MARRGLIIACVAVALAPFGFCLFPPLACYTLYGHLPLTGERMKAWERIKGKTREEVRALLGPPHNVAAYDPENVWRYLDHPLSTAIYCLRFGPDGRVSEIWFC